MSTYEDAAPNISKLVNLAAFCADFPGPYPPPEPQAELTAQAKAALYAAFRDEYRANAGCVNLGRLARQQRVPLRWCRILMDEVTAAKAAIYGA